ncbi:glycosyltransferase family 9 protein [Serratia plymuthica]|uniref:glycosyltransferase family 9 protein n=1 Tax=Serratia plymuthica TaxID=82996 RepID=UPI003DA32AA0
MNDSLLTYTGSLLLDGRYIVSPYGVSKEQPGGDISPLCNSIVQNNAISKISVDYSKAKTLLIINGLGVTLGDSVVGISALHAIKNINPNIIIRVIRPEKCSNYVNEVYTLASHIINDIYFMPFDISNTEDADLIIDIGNQLYWDDFNKLEMHDFFLRNLGLEHNLVPVEFKNNTWIKNSVLEDINLGEYVLFCPHASTKIRSIPQQYHYKIISYLSDTFKIKVLGFSDVCHKNYTNISELSKNTAYFASIIKHSKYLYTCDSAALHIGAGFKIPTTCIFTTVKPEFRSLYYNNCESVYIGNDMTEGIHNSEDITLVNSICKEFEVYYA